MKICVITDDNSGINKLNNTYKDVKILRMPIIIDGEVYFEGETLTHEEFFARQMKDENCSTSQPSPGEVMVFWKETLEEYDAIIHMPMSSGLTQSVATALQLAKEETEFKDKVFVVDNHRISISLRAALEDALTLVSKGYEPAKIKEILEDEAKNSSIYILVDDLKYLKKGGRITPAAALLGSALHIKPILSIMGGKLDAYEKVIGFKKAEIELINALKKERETKFKDYKDEDLNISVAYSCDKETLNNFLVEFDKVFDAKKSQRYVDRLPISVCVHTGSGSIGVAISKKIK